MALPPCMVRFVGRCYAKLNSKGAVLPYGSMIEIWIKEIITRCWDCKRALPMMR